MIVICWFVWLSLLRLSLSCSFGFCFIKSFSLIVRSTHSFCKSPSTEGSKNTYTPYICTYIHISGKWSNIHTPLENSHTSRGKQRQTNRIRQIFATMLGRWNTKSIKFHILNIREMYILELAPVIVSHGKAENAEKSETRGCWLLPVLRIKFSWSICENGNLNILASLGSARQDREFRYGVYIHLPYFLPVTDLQNKFKK